MNAPGEFLSPDIQSITDARDVAINRGGIKSFMHPITVKSQKRGSV